MCVLHRTARRDSRAGGFKRLGNHEPGKLVLLHEKDGLIVKLAVHGKRPLRPVALFQTADGT